MKSYKTQFAKITDTFISVTAVITAAILVASGLAVTKVNTEYMESGVRTAKIVSERENEEIFFSMNGRKFSPPERFTVFSPCTAECDILFRGGSRKNN